MANLTTAQLIELIKAGAAKYGIDADVAVEQLRRESAHFNPHYVFGPGKSPAGAMGLTQFIPETAARFGLKNPYDPAQAIEAWGKYMTLLLKRFKGRYDLALAGYNSGENRQEYDNAAAERRPINWAVFNKLPGIQKETKPYVEQILTRAGKPLMFIAEPAGPESSASSGLPVVLGLIVLILIVSL